MSAFGSQKPRGRSSLSIATGHFFWSQWTLHACGAHTYMQTSNNTVLIDQTHNFVLMLFLAPVLFTCYILRFCCQRIPKDTNSRGVEGLFWLELQKFPGMTAWLCFVILNTDRKYLVGKAAQFIGDKKRIQHFFPGSSNDLNSLQ